MTHNGTTYEGYALRHARLRFDQTGATLGNTSANPHGTRVLLHNYRLAQDRQGRRDDLCDIAGDVDTEMKEADKSSAEETN
jgi:hypothetical protein